MTEIRRLIFLGGAARTQSGGVTEGVLLFKILLADRLFEYQLPMLIINF